MESLTREELEERLYVADEIIKTEAPSDPVEKAEWIDNLYAVADEFFDFADKMEGETTEVNWDTLSYPARLRGIAAKARNCAESFETPTEDRSLENIFYPSGGE